MKKKVGLKILIVAAAFMLSLLGVAVGNSTASAAGGIYQGGGTLELRGGTINSEVYVYSGTCNYYDATFGSSGYIYLTSGCYVTIKQAPTSTINIKMSVTSTGTVVARCSGVSASLAVQRYINVQNLGSTQELVWDGDDLVIASTAVTLTVSAGNNGTVVVESSSIMTSPDALNKNVRLSIYKGYTFSTSGQRLYVYDKSSTRVATILAKPDSDTSSSYYTYSFGSWSSASGTVNSTMTVTASFSQSLKSGYAEVKFIVSAKALPSQDLVPPQVQLTFLPKHVLTLNNSFTPASIIVKTGTTFTSSINQTTYKNGTVTFSDGQSASAVAGTKGNFDYYLTSFSPSSGTVSSSMSITASFSTIMPFSVLDRYDVNPEKPEVIKRGFAAILDEKKWMAMPVRKQTDKS